MLTRPKALKFAKSHKGRVNPVVKLNNTLIGGQYGLIAKEAGRISSAQLAASSLAIKRKLKKDGKLLMRVFPHIPVSGKPAEVRMGKGKGAVKYFMARVRPGALLLEINTNKKDLALSALKVAMDKFSIVTKIVNVN